MNAHQPDTERAAAGDFGAVSRIAREMLDELLPLVDRFSVGIIFWDYHTRQLLRYGDACLVRTLEQAAGNAGELPAPGSPLAVALETAVVRAEQMESPLPLEGGNAVAIVPVVTDSSHRLGAVAVISSSEDIARAACLMQVVARFIGERYSSFVLKQAHHEAVRLIGQALAAEEPLMALLDADLRIKLITPALVNFLGLETSTLGMKLDEAVHFGSRGLASYCDGRLRLAQPLRLTTPKGSVQVTADFHMVSLGPREPKGTLLVVTGFSLEPPRIPLRSEKSSFEVIAGKSAELTRAKMAAVAASKLTSHVLIEGPKGSGKQLLARAIHFESTRRDGPFVLVDCSFGATQAIDLQLLGYAGGPMTVSSSGGSAGGLERASGGTLYIDEAGLLAPETQRSLLSAIRTREFVPRGGGSPIAMNARVIAGSSEALADKVRDGTFRGDLYYELSLNHIRLVPLSRRIDDIPDICDTLLPLICARLRREPQGISKQALELLMKYDWPGNIDELHDVLTQATAACERGTIKVAHLPSHFRDATASAIPRRPADPLRQQRQGLAEAQRALYRMALETSSWNVSAAAKTLGISRASLYRKMTALGISRRSR